jgi:hypothetical protein
MEWLTGQTEKNDDSTGDGNDYEYVCDEHVRES